MDDEVSVQVLQIGAKACHSNYMFEGRLRSIRRP